MAASASLPKLALSVFGRAFEAARRTSELADRETRPPGYFRAPINFRGINVTAETLVELSAMWACGMAISKPLAASTCEVFAVDGEGNRTLQRGIPLWELLNFSPNPSEGAITAFHFWQSKIFEAVLAGDSYAEIERSRGGTPVALHSLHRRRVMPRYDSRGRAYYEYTNPNGGVVNLDPQDVFHVRAPTYDGLTSYRLWEVGRLLFNYSRAVEVFGASYFANGAHLGEVFETDRELTEAQWQRLQEQLETQHGGPGAANDYMILENGLKFKTIASSPEAAQFIQTRQFLVEEVCRFTGVPPHKISHLLRSTFNNIEEQNIDFKNDTLIPWATPIQQEIKLKLIGRRSPLDAEFDLDWISEGSILDVAEADAKRVTHGIATRDEIRQRRGLNKRGGKADTLTVQKQMKDLEELDDEDEFDDAADADGDDQGGGVSRARQREIQRRTARQLRRREENG